MRLALRAAVAGAETQLECHGPGFPSVTWDAEAGVLHLALGRFGSEWQLRLTLSSAETRELWTRLREEYIGGRGEALAALQAEIMAERRRQAAEQAKWDALLGREPAPPPADQAAD